MVPSPVAGSSTKRNWSLVPQMSPPPPATVHAPDARFCPPAGVAPPMSPQVQPAGQSPGGADAPLVTARWSKTIWLLTVWLLESPPQPASKVPGIASATVDPATTVHVVPSLDV